MSEQDDLYEILQVHPSAHPEVIRAAYRRLAQLYDPDTNPSPEATELMARINRAYEVLGNAEQRASYDIARGVPNSQSTVQGTNPRSRAAARQDSPDFFTLGSRKSEVTRVQGQPRETNKDRHFPDEETWGWGSGDHFCSVTFNKAGRVVGWMNRGDLRVRIIPTDGVADSDFFTIGSYRGNVARVQGTPFRIEVPSRFVWTREEIEFDRKYGIEVDDDVDLDEMDRETWHFPGGIVEFSMSDGWVTAFQNKDGTLKARRVDPDSDGDWQGSNFFTIGSARKEVETVQGIPSTDKKNPLLAEEWRYGSSIVTFKLGWTSRVQGWDNADRNLKVRLVPGIEVTDSDTFNLDSHKDDVVRLQGTPHRVSVDTLLGYQTWRFSGGTVYLDLSDGRVIYYENRDGSLKTQGIRPVTRRNVAFENFRKSRSEKDRKSRNRRSVGCVGMLFGVIALLVILGWIVS